MAKKITLELTSDQAEEILIALSFRALQEKRVQVEIDETDQIGHALSTAFEKTFGWDTGVYAHKRKNDVKIRVLLPKPVYK